MVPVATWQSNPPEQLLKERFRISTGFHPGQRDIIKQLVQGKRLLVIQRTGWGKSLCYQMASLYYPHLTLVFSPLKALMRDQCRRCNDVYTIPVIRLSDGMLKTATRFLEEEFLPRIEKRGTEKRLIMGVQGAKPPDGVRGVPEKLFFPFSPPQAAKKQNKRSEGHPRTPGQGLAAPVNPACQNVALKI